MKVPLFSVTLALFSVAAVVLAGSLSAARLALVVAPGLLILLAVAFTPRPSLAQGIYLHFAYQKSLGRKMKRVKEIFCEVLR
ncbi:MAG: hypothetical protein ACFB50_15760 [Rubrobacteraceae bacterium]